MAAPGRGFFPSAMASSACTTIALTSGAISR
jgi:hypothetical protein